MQHRKSNAAEARSVIREAIRSGSFARGSQLPSTRELAQQFQINRNTATKIYHELAGDNMIELVPNRPPIVVAGESSSSPAEAIHQRIRESLWGLLHEGQLTGLTPAEMTRMLTETTYEFFATYRTPRIYIVECNEVEARAYAQELTLKFESVVRPLLLTQLGTVGDADIIITPFFHLQEVKQRVRERTQHVVGLVVTADSSDIARIAAMVGEGPLGIVAVNLEAAERLRRLLGFQIDAPMITASPDFPHTLEAMQGKVECIVSTVRADNQAWSRMFDVPISLIRYHADEHSIEVLRNAIQHLGPVTTQPAMVNGP